MSWKRMLARSSALEASERSIAASMLYPLPRNFEYQRVNGVVQPFLTARVAAGRDGTVRTRPSALSFGG